MLQFISPWEFIYNNTNWIKDDRGHPGGPILRRSMLRLNDHVEFSHRHQERIRDAKLKMVNAALQKKKPALFLQPMSDWHLRSEFKNGVKV